MLTIAVDTREQVPWTFEGQPDVQTIRRRLDTADYSIDGLETRIAIERKSLDDWTGTVLRDRTRFYRELERLRAFDFRAVVIESSVREILAHRYKSQAHPSSVLGFVGDVAAGQSVPVYLGGTRAEAQVLVYYLLKSAAKKFGD